VAGPPALLLIRKLGQSMHRASRRSLQSLSEMLGVLEETLLGIRVVKAYTMEHSERKRFFRVNRRLLRQQYKMERIDAVTGPGVEALGLTAGLAAAGVAGFLVFRGTDLLGYFYRMDPYYFMAWLGALFALFDPVRKLAKVATKFQQADAAAKRIFELQDVEQERFVPNAPALPRHSRTLEFRRVGFRYPSASGDALRDVDLTVRAGETVAIVGPNGSGKTTLVSLVPRLLDPTAGAVLIDGQDVSRCSIRSLRRQIGLVTQDAVIFHATVAENIAYGLRRPKPQQVLEAARKAFVDEFVAELPAGYDTVVGEHGSTLSGGQRQRIAIARAILRDPAILIFDEAMSQIDAHSEQRIHQAMHDFVRGRTTLMIAHRFLTVLEADRIVVMNEGRLVDFGTHRELLDRCGLYRHLYETQLTASSS
jgi:ABC-type multidrug transport system fused ATPase/permease subunit